MNPGRKRLNLRLCKRRRLYRLSDVIRSPPPLAKQGDLGPGVTNFVTASAYAQLGAMPIMMISGQKPIKKSKQGRFQIIDVIEMMRPITKYTKQVVHGNSIPQIVR